MIAGQQPLSKETLMGFGLAVPADDRTWQFFPYFMCRTYNSVKSDLKDDDPFVGHGHEVRLPHTVFSLDNTEAEPFEDLLHM